MTLGGKLAVDITPTWIGLLRSLVELTKVEDRKAVATAWQELGKMAKTADLYVAASKAGKVKR